MPARSTRSALALGLALAAFLLGPPNQAFAFQDQPNEFVEARTGEIPTGAAELVTDATDRAVQEGLEWLVKQQNEDGSFGSGAYRGNVAVTSLCGLAFMSAGSTPGRGPYGAAIDQALEYVLDNTNALGFVCYTSTATHGPMYSHGFGTLFLAEAYGMTRRPQIREKLEKAVELIIDTQNEQGGWRYQPVVYDADLSVTICQINALRAARNAGLFVPKETVESCVNYVKQAQNGDGGFRYMLQGGSSAFPRSAAGVVALQSAGVYFGKEVDDGVAYLKQFTPDPRFGAGAATSATTSTATTTPRRPSGFAAATTGSAGTPPSATNCSTRATAPPRATGKTPSATNTAPPWPSSSSRCPTTTCRSSSAERLQTGPNLMISNLTEQTPYRPRPPRPPRGRASSRFLPLSAAFWVGLASALASAQSPPSEPVFEVRLTDATVVSGRILKLEANGPLVLDPLSTEVAPRRAEPRTIPLAQVVSMRRRGADPATAWPDGSQVVFPAGDRLRAVIGTAADGKLTVLPGALADRPTLVPLQSLLGVVLAPPSDSAALREVVRRIRIAPREAEVLWLANGDRQEGSLLGIGEESIPFETDAGPLPVPRSSVVAIGNSPALVRYPASEGISLELTFLDGSRLGLSGVRLEEGRLVGTARFGAEIAPALAEVRAIHVQGPGCAYLSDRAESGAQFVGYLGDHPGTYGRDSTWDDRPLRLRGQSYDRGLGTLPRTLLAYRLDSNDRRFQALIGLDDSAGPRGNVVFRVLVDGQERFASPPLARGSDPLAVDVDIAGAKVLILATEFGEGGDIQDSADWIEARLIRSSD